MTSNYVPAWREPCAKAGRTLRCRWTQGGAEQGWETQQGKHCVTQCQRTPQQPCCCIDMTMLCNTILKTKKFIYSQNSG